MPGAVTAESEQQRSRRKRKRRRRPPDRIYVAFIHGIGTTSEAAWVERSVAHFITWWRAARRGAEERSCPEACPYREGHRHIVLTQSPRQTHVIVDPVHWAVAEPGRFTAWWPIMQAGMLLGLLELAAAAYRAIEPLRRDTSASDV